MSDLADALPENLRENAVLVAAVKLIGRTGATDFSMHEHGHAGEPTIWIAGGTWQRDSGGPYQDVDAALEPAQAAMRLAERLVDGGRCTECQRQSMLWMDLARQPTFGALVCWRWYNPARQEFQRACLGLAPSDRQN